jgi:hypothetical protein
MTDKKKAGWAGLGILAIAALVIWGLSKTKTVAATTAGATQVTAGKTPIIAPSKTSGELDAERARLKAEGYILTSTDPVSGAEQWYNASKGKLYLLVTWKEIPGTPLSALPLETIKAELLKSQWLGDEKGLFETPKTIEEYRETYGLAEKYGSTTESWATVRAAEIKYGTDSPQAKAAIAAVAAVTPAAPVVSDAGKAVLATQKITQAQYTPYLSENGKAAAAAVQQNLQAQVAAGETPTVVPVVIPAGTTEGQYTVYIPGF